MRIKSWRRLSIVASAIFASCLLGGSGEALEFPPICIDKEFSAYLRAGPCSPLALSLVKELGYTCPRPNRWINGSQDSCVCALICPDGSQCSTIERSGKLLCTPYPSSHTRESNKKKQNQRSRRPELFSKVTAQALRKAPPTLTLPLEGGGKGGGGQLRNTSIFPVAGDFKEAIPANPPGSEKKGWFDRLKGAVVDVGKSVAAKAIDKGFLVANGLSDVLSAMRRDRPTPLADEQKAFIKRVYGDSLNADSITIQRNSLFMELVMKAPYVAGNTVYMPESWNGRPLFEQNGSLTKAGIDLMNHELNHVWQYQNGGSDYVSKAWAAQKESIAATGNRNGAYDWEKFYDQGVPFGKLNPEAQATLIETTIGSAQLHGATSELTGALLKVDPSGFDKRNAGEIDRIIRQALENEKDKTDEFKNKLAYVLNAWASVRNGSEAP